MEKKLLVIVCIVMVVAGYFITGYQDDKRKEQNEAIAIQEREREKAIQDSLEGLKPFNPLLEKEIINYVNTVSKDLGKSKSARRLYYLTLRKQDGKEYLVLETGYGFNQNQIQAFSRLNGNIIIYYGNPDNIEQNLVDTSKFFENLEQLDFYKDQKRTEDKTLTWKYIITDKDNLILDKK